jgi:hypothetical protein
MMPQNRAVRTDGTRFQVYGERSLPLPHGDSFDSWVEEMRTSLVGLEDAKIEYENANDEYGTEINAKGWMNATPEQVAVLKEHDFSKR